MSDFLGRLAARTLGVAPIVQPAARSMFSPALEQSGAPQESFAENISEPTRSNSDTAIPVTPLPSHKQSSTRDLAYTQDADFSVIDARVSRPSVLKGPDRQTETLFSSFRSPVPPTADRIPESARHESEGRQDIRPAAQDSHAQPGQVDSPATGLLVPAANFQREAFPVAATPFSHSADREHLAMTADSVPVIKVSIGRVEVRAEFPAQAPRTSSQRSPSLTLSLDEYARQRWEGKR